MEMNETLIKKFLQNLCSVEEAELICKHLQGHPGDLDVFLPEHQLDNTIMDPRKKEALLLKIKEQIRVARPVRKKLWLISIAAAAILLISFIGFWMGKEPITESISLEKSHTLVHINYGNEDLALTISDGSTILLKPKSEIRYLETFDSQKRDFHLKGAARFQVVKDSLRPFNVYAGGTLTTALGTEFTVSTFDTEEEVMIALHSGKVVVQPTNSVLVPGDKIFVNPTTLLARLNPALNKPVSSLKLAKGRDYKKRKEDSLLSFTNKPLDEIFSQLEAEFSLVIVYESKLIENRFFTGSFKRAQNVEMEIMWAIAQLNNLYLIKEENHYELTPREKVPKIKIN